MADAVYGANDGLGAVFGIVWAWPAPQIISSITYSFPVLRECSASTLSMGAGAYLAAKSEAEVYEAEISREQRRWKKIRKRRSKRWRSSISCKDSKSKNQSEWPGVWPNSRSNSSRRWLQRTWIIRASFSESLDIRHLSGGLDSDRRFRPNHPVLSWAACRSGCFFRHQSIAADPLIVGAVKFFITIRSW